MPESDPIPEDLVVALYDELRRLARRLHGSGEAFAPTSVVHEAFLRLRVYDGRYADSVHFKRVAARAMRQIVIDRHRSAQAEKRGGSAERLTLSDNVGGGGRAAELAAFAQAMERLDQADADAAEVASMRTLLGMNHAEIALALGVDERTAQRRWRRARAFLTTMIESG